MFEGWENYYLMIGSSAGALIGLMFVVVTLTAGRDRAEVERGKHLYTSPIVWHLAVILTLSGTAAVPKISVEMFGLAALGLAILGFGWGIRSTALSKANSSCADSVIRDTRGGAGGAGRACTGGGVIGGR